MHTVDGGPDIQVLADELLAPLLQWLLQIGKTPAEFRDALTRAESLKEQAELLGIPFEQLSEGIDKIGSLSVYAAVLGTTKEEVYRRFEANRQIVPSWLIKELEEALQGKIGDGCG